MSDPIHAEQVVRLRQPTEDVRPVPLGSVWWSKVPVIAQHLIRDLHVLLADQGNLGGLTACIRDFEVALELLVAKGRINLVLEKQ